MNRFQQIKRIALLPLVLSAFLLGSCGGGGGGGAGSAAISASSTAVSYKSVAQVGELISYTLDTATLSYSYTIEKSAFGLEGQSFSGTLVRNSDGTYTPSESPESRVMILPNGLLIGSVKLRTNNGEVTTSIVGMQNPARSIADFSDTFNYISYQCPVQNTNCITSMGSVRVDSSGVYQSCSNANVAIMSSNLADQCRANQGSEYSAGRLESNNDGTWKLMRATGNGYVDAGTFIAFKDSQGQKVAIFDLNDGVSGGYGYGSIVAASQQSLTAAATNGLYRANSSSGNYVTVTATDNAYVSYSPKFDFTENGTVSYDDPWMGVATSTATSSSNNNFTQGTTYDVIMAGSGVYISRNRVRRNEIEVGIRSQAPL
jgi:feruloyl esterase